MAPVPKKQSIEHFTHPSHRLSEFNSSTEFRCDGCKTLGQGKRYRCDACDFDLHDYCGTCPRTLTSFMHPHPLNLVVRKAQATRRNERVCNICGDHVEGLFYRCKDCEFDIHPLCTQLPQHLRHALHRAHPLTLQASLTSPCAFCGSACTSWRYRCGVCGFDIHLECVLAPCAPPTQRSTPPCGPIPPPPWNYGGYVPYGAPNFGSSPYNYSVGQAQGGGAVGGENKRLMYALVGKLAFGVLSNGMFGTPGGIDFSSFL